MDIPFAIDPEPDAETVERARKLFAGPCDFVKGAVSIATLPPDDRPEICFAGRSNVGKSSLINALTGRKGLARASNTPGRTQELNYFTLGASDTGGYLVDLPGYGYAEAPREKVAAWQEVLRAYLAGRRSLARVYLLIDGRHGLKAADREIIALLDRSAVSFQAVLTKADKPGAAAVGRTAEALAGALNRSPAAFPQIRTTSSEKGSGIAGLRADILSCIEIHRGGKTD